MQLYIYIYICIWSRGEISVKITPSIRVSSSYCGMVFSLERRVTESVTRNTATQVRDNNIPNTNLIISIETY